MAAGFQYIQRPDYVGNALSGLIGAQQQHEQENAAQDVLSQQNAQQQNAQRQQQDQQRIKFLIDQYLKQPGDVQSKLYATAPADIKQYLIDPSLAYNSPDAQMQRKIQETINQNKLGVAQNFHPTGGDTSAINYDFMTGKNAPKEFLDQGYMRDYLSPKQIGTTMMAPAVKDLATAGNQNAEAGLHTEQAKVVAPEAKSRINLQSAQAGEAGARTKKVQTESAGIQQQQQQQTAMNAPIGSTPRLQKTQTNTTGQTRTVYSDDGGATWHP